MVTGRGRVHSDSHADSGIHPRILTHAGTPKVAAGIVMMLVLAIDEYYKKEKFPPIMLNILNGDIPQYIDALVDDLEVRKEAQAFYEEVLSDADAARKAR